MKFKGETLCQSMSRYKLYRLLSITFGILLLLTVILIVIFFVIRRDIVITGGGQWHDSAGPWVIATKGEPWPYPANRVLNNQIYCLDPLSFSLQISQENCDILEDATKRYKEILLNELTAVARYNREQNSSSKNDNDDINCKDYLSSLEIRLRQSCERYPHSSSDESYTLQVPGNGKNVASLSAESVWGILRGLETFSQLITPPSENVTKHLMIRGQEIVDYPKFPFRGLLLDTSRHYLPVEDILLTLDAMAYNKLNVFHWHIVDDNSFPYESAVFPELSAKGAYHPSLTYSASNVQKIIEYARLRGIRVIPEFDTPGHTKSWGLSHPEFLTACYDSKGPTGKLGPMNPANQKLYDFMQQLLSEIAEKFPDNYIHLGGDEVPFWCWESNPAINSYMEQLKFGRKYEKLEAYYIQRILDIMTNLKAKPIVWQEVFDNGVTLHKDTVVQVWTGNWRDEMAAVTSSGYPALLSACWYLDHIAGGGDWEKYYDCDPLDFRTDGNHQKDLVLGGEACMWGEFVDRYNVHPRIWPRASAVAEKLWAITDHKGTAASRLEEHACRMNKRRIPAQPPNGPGFCVHNIVTKI